MPVIRREIRKERHKKAVRLNFCARKEQIQNRHKKDIRQVILMLKMRRKSHQRSL
jgi:hypothetical protein